MYYIYMANICAVYAAQYLLTGSLIAWCFDCEKLILPHGVHVNREPEHWPTFLYQA